MVDVGIKAITKAYPSCIAQQQHVQRRPRALTRALTLS